ncbi:hypothetical protein N0B44_21550 [Roseibacterium beibuensis]|uniref:hypothetical protein n=1 Tax=[Roseibacterium] beibuensis TaxID=1193142 RepID=UPI00217D1762|nr:hypothetical protein [Roseibacterium beibuensis]MCS6625502.1 hypothetical protein [Roseibacterium beibuensis]
MPRATGLILLFYGVFHLAMGLAQRELPWLMTAILLGIGGAALLLVRPWSRTMVYAAALAAAAVGLISQVSAAAGAGVDIPLAIVIWALWTSLWLAVAYVGVRYLPDGRTAPEPL